MAQILLPIFKKALMIIKTYDEMLKKKPLINKGLLSELQFGRFLEICL
jgi:hypothetical protein